MEFVVALLFFFIIIILESNLSYIFLKEKLRYISAT